ncbi:hypothetical protein ACMU6081_26860 [Achromobacter mucicolens]
MRLQPRRGHTGAAVQRDLRGAAIAAVATIAAADADTAVAALADHADARQVIAAGGKRRAVVQDGGDQPGARATHAPDLVAGLEHGVRAAAAIAAQSDHHDAAGQRRQRGWRLHGIAGHGYLSEVHRAHNAETAARAALVGAVVGGEPGIALAYGVQSAHTAGQQIAGCSARRLDLDLHFPEIRDLRDATGIGPAPRAAPTVVVASRAADRFRANAPRVAARIGGGHRDRTVVGDVDDVAVAPVAADLVAAGIAHLITARAADAGPVDAHTAKRQILHRHLPIVGDADRRSVAAGAAVAPANNRVRRRAARAAHGGAVDAELRAGVVPDAGRGVLRALHRRTIGVDRYVVGEGDQAAPPAERARVVAIR